MGKTDPGISDAMTELVDFYATVMDYADIKPQRTQFGISLRPVIEDRRNENRKYVFCEGGRLPEEKHCDEFHVSGPNGPSEKFAYWPKMKAQTDDEAHAKATMIRSTEFKYVSRILDQMNFMISEKTHRKNTIVFMKSVMKLKLQRCRLHL